MPLQAWFLGAAAAVLLTSIESESELLTSADAEVLTSVQSVVSVLLWPFSGEQGDDVDVVSIWSVWICMHGEVGLFVASGMAVAVSLLPL